MTTIKSIEEKASRYDKAIERAKVYKGLQAEMEFIFPELKESEDERIRKALLEMVHDTTGDSLWVDYNVHKEDAIAWLEKQGEQKPAENKGMNLVEEEMTPFQKKVFCIIDTTIEEEQGLKQVCDELLTLASNEIKQKPTTEIKSAEESLGIDSDTYNKIVDDCIYGEQKPAETEKGAKGNEREIPFSEQEWSEEDEKKLNRIYTLLAEAANKHAFSTTCRLIGDKECVELQDFLKSLRPQKQWKPSDEQMETLENVRKILHTNDIYSKANNLMYNFEELIRTLKKLREGQL